MDVILSSDLKNKVLARIVQRYREKNGPDKKFGRIQMQKLTYFIKASGVDLPFKFEINIILRRKTGLICHKKCI